MAGLLGLSGPAWAQSAPLDDLLVASPGTTMEVFSSGAEEYDGSSFIENYGLDITVVARAQGALRVDGSPRLLVTALRLSDVGEAADVLAAIGDPVSAEDMNSTAEMDGFWAELDLPAPHIETLPQPRRDVVARRIVMSEDYGMVEIAWATGRDVVVLADLAGEGPGDAPPPIMHEVLEAHRAAFPDVTMPAGARSGPSWVLIGGGAAAVLVILGLLVVRAGRRPTTRTRPPAAPVPQVPADGPPRARANW